MAIITAEIINEFVEQIDTDKEYVLKELKEILSSIYKTKTVKPKSSKQSKKTIQVDSDSDEEKPKKRGRPAKVRLDKDGNEKEKRTPSAYNIYVKQRIEALKMEQPDTPAKELMKMAASQWKLLDKDEKEQYKI